MEEEVGDWLPDAQAREGAEWDKAEFVIDPGGGRPASEDRRECLSKKNARASQNYIFNGWSDKAAPVEADSRRAERLAHPRSVRRGMGVRQKDED